MTSVPDWIVALGVVVAALAGLAGYWLAGHNEEARDIRTAERETRARASALAERLADRRHEFQLGLLLEPQDVLQRSVRSTAQVIMQDQRTLRQTGHFHLQPKEYSDEAYATRLASTWRD